MADVIKQVVIFVKLSMWVNTFLLPEHKDFPLKKKKRIQWTGKFALASGNQGKLCCIIRSWITFTSFEIIAVITNDKRICCTLKKAWKKKHLQTLPCFADISCLLNMIIRWKVWLMHKNFDEALWNMACMMMHLEWPLFSMKKIHSSL